MKILALHTFIPIQFRVTSRKFRESFSLLRESFAFIRESLLRLNSRKQALIRENFALFREGFALIREKYNVFPYENEPNGLLYVYKLTYLRVIELIWYNSNENLRYRSNSTIPLQDRNNSIIHRSIYFLDDENNILMNRFQPD